MVTIIFLIIIFILLNILKYEEIITKEVLLESDSITTYVTKDEYLKISKNNSLIYNDKEYTYKIKEISTTENNVFYKIRLEVTLDKTNVITTIRFFIEKKTLWQKLLEL